MTSVLSVATLRSVTSGSMIATDTFLLSNELRDVRELDVHFLGVSAVSLACFDVVWLGLDLVVGLSTGCFLSCAISGCFISGDFEIEFLSIFGLFSFVILSTIDSTGVIFLNLERMGEVVSAEVLTLAAMGITVEVVADVAVDEGVVDVDDVAGLSTLFSGDFFIDDSSTDLLDSVMVAPFVVGDIGGFSR